MPELIPGYDTQQKTITVANNDTALNASITAEAAEGWMVTLMILSGSDMVLLYSRNVEIVAP